MSDKMIRALARGGNVRILMIKSTDLVENARVIHDTYPTVSAALGRTINVSLMMAFMLKEKTEKLVVEIRGDGQLKHILVNADNEGFVRASVSNPHVFQVNENTGKLDVGGIIGSGTLKVSREREGRTVYNSLVELQSGEIGDDFAYYFAQSEQTPSAVSVGVLVDKDLSIKSSGGILIQMLPSATDDDIIAVENIVSSMRPVSDLMVEDDVYKVFTDLFEDGVILETHDIAYHCGCNREQMEDVVRTLSTDEINTLISEDNGITLECHYCHTSYHFDEEALREIINERN